MKNVLFEITVNTIESKSNSQETFDYGYADITKFSHFCGEEEVIFNPLSSFKIT